MGHHVSACQAQRQKLPMLPRALPRHHLQHNAQKKNSILHRQPNRALCWHLVSDRSDLLFAER